MARLFALALGALALASCSRRADVFLPPVPGAQSALLISSGPERLELHALGALPGTIELEDADAQLTGATALFYAVSLEALQLAPGPVRLLAPDAPSRLLPPFIALRRAPAETEGAWMELVELEPPLSELRVAPFDLGRCVRQGGCFDTIAAPGMCVVDCAGPATLAPPLPPIPPEPAAPPNFLPCPAPWTERLPEADGAQRCEPPASPPVLACDLYESQRFGEAACTRVGSVCPDGDFATSLPSGSAVIYVRAGATGGDGTVASPYGSISEAITNAAQPSVLALAKGSFVGPNVLPDGFALHGACPRLTILTDPAAPIGSQLLSVRSGARAAVRNLRLSGGDGGAFVPGGAELVLEDVIFEGLAAGALDVDGGRAIVSRVFVRNSGVRTAYALSVRAGGSLTLDHAVIEDFVGDAVHHEGVGTRSELGDLAVRRATLGPNGQGSAIYVAGDGTSALRRVSIEDHPARGLATGDATITAVDLSVRFGAARTPESRGIELGLDTHATLERVEITGAAECGLLTGQTTVLQLEDAIIRGSDRGVCVIRESRASLARVYLEGSTGYSVFAEGDLDAEDLWVRGGDTCVLAPAPETRLWGRRWRIEGCERAVEANGAVDLEDMIVLDIAADGIVGHGTSFRVVRARAERVASSGVFADGVGTATISDVTLRHARGINVVRTSANVQRVDLEDGLSAVVLDVDHAYVSDLSARRMEQVFAARNTGHATTSILERVRGEDALGTAFTFSGARWEVRDLDNRGGYIGLHVTGETLPLSVEAHMSLERSRFLATSGTAIQVMRGSSLFARDLLVDGADSAVHSKETLERPTELDLERFHVARGKKVGVWSEVQSGSIPTVVHLENGVLEGHGVALRGAGDWTEQLTRVVFRDNLVDLE